LKFDGVDLRPSRWRFGPAGGVRWVRGVRACAGRAHTPAPAARLSVSHFVRGRLLRFSTVK
jgi:hypothetical protein